MSALINPENEIGEILLNPSSGTSFIAPELMRTEYFKHKKKVLKYSKMDLLELREIEFILFDAIEFLSIDTIPLEIKKMADELVRLVDINDSIFIAATVYSEGKLWTLDKKLIAGLQKNKFFNFIYTKEVRKHWSNL